MFKRTVSEDDLARLKDEREDVDRAYNAAITALDGAVQQLRQLPDSPLLYDDTQLATLNTSWDLLAPDLHAGRGWRARVRTLICRAIAPMMTRQQTFNSALVDHINRNAGMHRELSRAVGQALVMVREEFARLATFQTRLVEYSQQITPYVDTKDREVNGLMRRINEDVAETTNRLEQQIVGLAGGLSGVGDELQKRWESMVARERRYVARVDELRATSAATHRVTQALNRQLTTLQAARETSPVGGRTTSSTPPTTIAEASRADPIGSKLDSYKYVAFEDLFRGSYYDIRARVATYLPYFEGAADVLDAGCGRGEFLELLRDHGISARGVDINHEMVEQCRERGLTVDEGDVLSRLVALEDESLGGLFAAQVVEHLEPAYLLALLDTAFHKLRPGSKLVLETINVASWSAFFQSYVRDITHVRPLHPDTLKYLVTASGFQKVDVTYRSPCAEQTKLEPLPASTIEGPIQDLAPSLNRNVEKLNRLLFADQDYAVVGERP